MSAPAGLWTIWDLKVEGSAGWAVAICGDTAASAIPSRVVALILELRPIHFSLRCVSWYQYNACRGAGGILIEGADGRRRVLKRESQS